MNPKCPECRPIQIYVQDFDYLDMPVMCDLVGKLCLVEYGKPEDCDVYQEFLKEEQVGQ